MEGYARHIARKKPFHDAQKKRPCLAFAITLAGIAYQKFESKIYGLIG